MRQGELDKLLAEAQVERNRKIRDAHREYSEAVKHIRWLKAKLKVRTVRRERLPEESPENSSNGDGMTLAAAVRVAAGQMNDFTADTITGWLDKHHADLDAGRRREAVAIVLSRLVKSGLAEVVERGCRGKAQVYKKTPKFQREDTE